MPVYKIDKTVTCIIQQAYQKFDICSCDRACTRITIHKYDIPSKKKKSCFCTMFYYEINVIMKPKSNYKFFVSQEILQFRDAYR